MNKLLAIFKKDTIIRFVSPSEWLFFLILPIFFTFVLAGGTANSTDPRTRVAIVDFAQSELSDSLITELQHNQSLRIELLAQAEAEKQFEKRDIAAVLTIPESFDLKSINPSGLTVTLRLQPDNLDSLAANQAIQAGVRKVNQPLLIAQQTVYVAEELEPFENETDRWSFFRESLLAARQRIATAPERLLVTRGETVDSVEYDPRANSSAGQMITWVFIPLFGISVLFAYERNKGTLKRVLISPTSRATFLFATIFTAVFWALVQMLLLILFGSFVMKLNWGQAPLALALILLASALAAAAIGVAMGAIVRTESQANGLSIMLGMVMALLGGCWYPIELFPNAVQQIVKILPTSWAMQGMLDIVLRQQGLAAVLPEVAVLLGFALLFFVVGIIVLNQKGRFLGD